MFLRDYLGLTVNQAGVQLLADAVLLGLSRTSVVSMATGGRRPWGSLELLLRAMKYPAPDVACIEAY